VDGQALGLERRPRDRADGGDQGAAALEVGHVDARRLGDRQELLAGAGGREREGVHRRPPSGARAGARAPGPAASR
jgi:hypothetical protein